MRRVVIAGLLAAALSLSSWLAFGSGRGTSAHGTTIAELKTYEARLIPLVSAGGEVVEQSMKPALHDLRYDHVTPPAFMATEAAGWLTSLSSTRAQVMAITTNPELAAVSRTIAEALDEYVDAARYFRSAMLTKGAAREQLVTAGLEQARSADAVYDRGSASLQSIRHRLGLSANPYFPGGGNG